MKSLVGDYREEHLFTLRQSLESYRHYQNQKFRGSSLGIVG